MTSMEIFLERRELEWVRVIELKIRVVLLIMHL